MSGSCKGEGKTKVGMRSNRNPNKQETGVQGCTTCILGTTVCPSLKKLRYWGTRRVAHGLGAVEKGTQTYRAHSDIIQGNNQATFTRSGGRNLMAGDRRGKGPVSPPDLHSTWKQCCPLRVLTLMEEWGRQAAEKPISHVSTSTSCTMESACFPCVLLVRFL